MLAALLGRDGIEVVEAASGQEALEIALADRFDLVLSDWVMPGMDGPTLCREMRGRLPGRYVYFILLTSKRGAGEVAAGLGSGADDFLSKPVDGQELRARIAAGGRILQMERELTQKNRSLTAALADLRRIHDALDRDLAEARNLQQSLLRERHRSFGSAEVSLVLHPSGHVGGDLVGFFPINARRVGLFALDVAGHGVASALMTARLAGLLSGSSPDQNLALVQTDFGIYDGRPPAELAAQLNAILLAEMSEAGYLTLLYADVDLVSGRVSMVQAGHPHPAVLRAGGEVEFCGSGGLPIGLLPGAQYAEVEVRLNPGDRLLLISDGVTEAADAQGRLLEEEGMARLLRRAAGLPGPDLLAALVAGVTAHAEGEPPDDVSAVCFDFHGAKRNAD